MDTFLPFEGPFYSLLILVVDLLIRIGISLRVIMRKRAWSVTVAWLVVILFIPFAGGVCYLLFGENRLPGKRIERAKLSYDTYMFWLQGLKNRAPVHLTDISARFQPMQRQAEALVGIPALGGNCIELLPSPELIIGSILSGIESATSTCHLEFYIWEEGGRIGAVNDAIIAAADRGVVCRMLLDSVGSREFLNSRKAREMEAAGVRIQASLPTGILSAFFSRADIRNHRKIVVIDGYTAWTGSQNMVDPDCFKKDAGVGNWIDVMARITGPVVETLAGTFFSDWFLERERQNLHSSTIMHDITKAQKAGDIRVLEETGTVPIQFVPSGPGPDQNADTIRNLLLTAIYSARESITLTTPYFIPGEPLLVSLKSVAEQGVKVRIILPRTNDSTMVHYASRARWSELLRAGVEMYLFSGGLLHSKTITVDGELSLFGSVNLDMRSFWLNFEATLFIYNQDFTERLLSLQQGYLKQSELLTWETFQKRSTFERFKENIYLLVSPLL